MKIKRLIMQNFKGCKNANYDFSGKNVTVSGANGSGKTTMFDALTWLLFGRDSLDNTRFEVRPLGENGKQIDNIDICVTVIFEINGEDVELKKTQSQNWVKKRGSEFPTFQGNVNTFEVDGYPKGEKEYKEYINSIVNDDLFKMLTNPQYFPNMPWKEQRTAIMKMVSEVSDIQLAEENEQFSALASEIKKAPSLDDIKAKYAKSINGLKKQQTEIPVRIDEVSNSKVDIDIAELELQKNVINEELTNIKSQIAEIDAQIEKYQELSSGILELKFAESDMIRKANEGNAKKRSDLEKEIRLEKTIADKTRQIISACESEIKSYLDCIQDKSNELDIVREEYKAELDRVFDEYSLICPYCKQEYPSDKKEQLRADFKAHKDSELNRITDKGNVAKERIENDKVKLAKVQGELPEHKKMLENQLKNIAKLEKELSEIPEITDISNSKEYLEIVNKLKEKEQALFKMNDLKMSKESIISKHSEVMSQLVDCEKKLSSVAKNIEIDERIEELQLELKETGIKIASQEKILYLLDEFIKYKLDKISNSINSMFDGVEWKLFDVQINGGIKEVCECTVNGVPYGSLNNGHRIVAGLQIIKALQKINNAYLPIFIDNAESLNDFNIPEMQCQLIKLKVSEDKELRIEVG